MRESLSKADIENLHRSRFRRIETLSHGLPPAGPSICRPLHQPDRWGIQPTLVAEPQTNGVAERRDWRIHAALAQRLITQARTLYVDEELGLDLTNTVYALDSTTIALCLSVFPWAHFRTTKAESDPISLDTELA